MIMPRNLPGWLIVGNFILPEHTYEMISLLNSSKILLCRVFAVFPRSVSILIEDYKKYMHIVDLSLCISLQFF